MPLTTAGIHFLPTRIEDTIPLADKNEYIKPIMLDATPEMIIRNFLPTTFVAPEWRADRTASAQSIPA